MQIFLSCILGFFGCLMQLHLSQSTQVNIATLRLVQAIWRHGDRTPTATFPTDTHNPPSSWDWANGMGQLTELGMQQHHRLGTILRQRYAGFISDNFDPREVRVESTRYNRTVMSAIANMMGVFPATTTIPGTKIQFWKAVPVFTRLSNDHVNNFYPLNN